jgi:NAD(P)-dependent dehydrogenase (short-subunit alcohol dehydrogenase family)
MIKVSRPVALVTGARQGIGRAIALALATGGFDIAVLDLVQDEKADSLLAELKDLGVRGCFVTMDLADVDSHAAAVDRVENELGPIDALINNAGIAVRPLVDIMDVSKDVFDGNIAVNLRGTFFLTQEVGRRMLARESEHHRSVIFITSIAATHVSIVRSPYCVSKAGLSMAAQVFAARLAEGGIAVYEIRPGFIKTDMLGSSPSKKIDRYIADGVVPQRRWGQPKDIGQVAASLATGLLPYVTGQPIYVDGGFHITTG